MKIRYISTPVQDENTVDPELIDGEFFHWDVSWVRLRGTLQEEIKMLTDRGKVEYLLIHDIKSCDKFFCDQGCKPGHGCKEFYTENNHAVVLICHRIKYDMDEYYNHYADLTVEEEDKAKELCDEYNIVLGLGRFNDAVLIKGMRKDIHRFMKVIIGEDDTEEYYPELR